MFVAEDIVMPRPINARELATHLGVTPETILAWGRRGLIPCLRVSRRPVLFDLAEVEQALRSHGRQPERRCDPD
jgi:predicted site-specific integrase-resolvase